MKKYWICKGFFALSVSIAIIAFLYALVENFDAICAFICGIPLPNNAFVLTVAYWVTCVGIGVWGFLFMAYYHLGEEYTKYKFLSFDLVEVLVSSIVVFALPVIIVFLLVSIAVGESTNPQTVMPMFFEGFVFIPIPFLISAFGFIFGYFFWSEHFKLCNIFKKIEQ